MEISTYRLQALEPDDDGADEDDTMRVWCLARQLHADGSRINDLDESWLVRLPGSSLAQTFGMRFSRAMMSWLLEQSEAEDMIVTRWTWLELSVYTGFPSSRT